VQHEFHAQFKKDALNKNNADASPSCKMIKTTIWSKEISQFLILLQNGWLCLVHEFVSWYPSGDSGPQSQIFRNLLLWIQ
jgi:hypothetical protein